MVIDFITLGLIILAIFKGVRNGLVLAIFSFLAFIIGLAAAMKLSAVVAGYLGTNTSISQRWLPVLAFAIVFFIVVFLVRLGAKAIEGVLKLAMLGWLNKLGGIIFYALLYLFTFSIILFYAQQLHIIKPQVSQFSMTYPWIYPMAPSIIEGLGTILPFFKNMFTDLQNFFDQLSKNAS
jgi:membrane protein required for colicin V production